MINDPRARWFRTLFDNARIGIVVVDPDDRIVDANPALEKMLGAPADELRGTLFADHTPPADEDDDARPLIDAVTAADEPGYCEERRYLRADGVEVWGRTTAWRVGGEGGAPDRVLGMIQDVTAERKLEQRLHEQTELARLGEMAAVVAHEVRNPLTGIGGAVQILRDRLPADSPDRALLSEVHERLRGLNRIVEALMLFARPLAPKLSLLSLREVVDTCASRLQADDELAGTRISIAGPDVTIAGDRTLLDRLFCSLLLNASQAMQGRGAIRVALDADKHACSVEIEDEGAGFDDDVSRRLFEPFFTTRSKGTGLGLAIARKVAEAHGGSIEAGSALGGGALLRVTLPREPTAKS